MQAYNDLAELARICRKQAESASSPEIAAELTRLAEEYEHRAADANGDNDPHADISSKT